MKILEVKKLNKFYNGFQALNDVNITVEANEVYGFIGRNGAGKTTTINCVLSLLDYQSGEVFFDGNRVSKNSKHDKRYIGYVPDVPSFPGYMTAVEFLNFVYDTYQLPRDSKSSTIEDILGRVQLPIDTKKIAGYSRGMKQRLAIAQALIHKPKLLIMDEPTSALDPLGRKDILEIIKDLKKDLTIFYSTHILEDAQKVCDRIGLIDEGRIILEAPLKEVINQKQQTFYIETMKSPKITLEQIKSSNLTSEESFYQEGILFTLKDINKLLDFQKELIDNHLGIIQLKPHEKSLEDVFVEVLNENNPSL